MAKAKVKALLSTGLAALCSHIKTVRYRCFRIGEYHGGRL